MNIIYLKEKFFLKTKREETQFKPDPEKMNPNSHLEKAEDKTRNEIYESNKTLKKENFSNLKFYTTVSIIGTIRGGISLLIEHPLESIKTQWQDKNKIKSTKEIIKEIYREKGIIGFYRGFTLNCMRVSIKNCYRWPMMLFFPSLFERTIPKNLIHKFPSMPKILTGLTIANIEVFIVCPLDRLKIFFMTSTSKSINMFKHFYTGHRENLVAELYRGLGVTFWRSNVSWVSFLYLDYKLKILFKKSNPTHSLSVFDLFFISILVGVGNLASSKIIRQFLFFSYAV